MKKICKHCQIENNYRNIKCFAAHVSCCKFNPNVENKTRSKNSKKNILIHFDKELGKFKEFKLQCHTCQNVIYVKEREKIFTKKQKYFCSRSCANSRGERTNETKQKISKTIKLTILSKKNNTKIHYNVCKCCDKLFISAKYTRKICSNECRFKMKSNIGKIYGKILASKQIRRSKNEIEFANLCIKYFGENDILTNEQIFNGWDADVIIKSLKIAILWNGKWHYEQCNKNHSVEQVQNRDRLKIIEILKYGYKPYIIKDMKGENKNKVKKEFDEFLFSLNDKRSV